MAREHYLNDLARNLRRDATEAEKKLWQYIRNRQIGGAKFRRQVQLDDYIADFLCAEARLIIELDGGQHTPEGDAVRTAYLTGQNFRIIRFWNDDVLRNVEGVLEVILSALVK
jgi:very-short-patch-repair endonuclease